MDRRPLTCAEVDERDLDTRYLAGTLDEAEAEAFEAHYFACERCWATVRSGLSVRAAEEGDAPVARGGAPDPTLTAPPTVGLPRRSAPFRGWIPVAAAAAVLILAVGTWRGFVSEGSGAGETLRGADDALHVRASRDAGAVTAAWPRVPGADRYIVRLFDARGALLAQEDRPDTIAQLTTTAPLPDSVFIDVQAVGPLRELLVRSPSTAVPPAGDRRP